MRSGAPPVVVALGTALVIACALADLFVAGCYHAFGFGALAGGFELLFTFTGGAIIWLPAIIAGLVSAAVQPARLGLSTRRWTSVAAATLCVSALLAALEMVLHPHPSPSGPRDCSVSL